MAGHAPSEERWRTVRVFISSTFRDTHGERDLLTRNVFPRLRAWAAQRLVQVLEIDLRWGVTETESRLGQAPALCLKEVSACDIVVGLLGSRYGWAPDNYGIAPRDEFEWVSRYPAGRSITELEVSWGVLNSCTDRASKVKRSLFYFRKEDFLDDVPPRQQSVFVDGSFNEEEQVFVPNVRARTMLEMLKVKLLAAAESRNDVFVQEPYDASFTAEGQRATKLVVSGLHDWGERVFQDLCGAIDAICPANTAPESLVRAQRRVHDGFRQQKGTGVVGRQDEVRKLCDAIIAETTSTPPPAIVVSGEPGVGKSSVLAAALTKLGEWTQHAREEFAEANTVVQTWYTAASRRQPKRLQTAESQPPEPCPPIQLPPVVVFHFVGVAPGSDNLRHILRRLVLELRDAWQETVVLLQPPHLGHMYEASRAHLVFNTDEGREAVAWASSESPPRGDMTWLRRVFLALTRCLCSARRVVLVLDGLDALRPAHGALLLDWLPSTMRTPPELQVVVSCNTPGSNNPDDRCLSTMNRRGCLVHEVKRLTRALSEETLHKAFAIFGKRLDSEQMAELMKRREAVLPLFQAVAAEELRVFDEYEFVLDRVKRLPHGLNELLEQVLARLEGDHGFDIVRDATCLLLCARRGITDSELVALLQTSRQRWTALRTALSPYLRSDEETGATTLSTRSMREAVEARYTIRGTRRSPAPAAATAGPTAVAADASLVAHVPHHLRVSLRHYHLVLASFSRATCAGLDDMPAASFARTFSDPSRSSSSAVVVPWPEGVPFVSWTGSWDLTYPSAMHAASDVAFHLMHANRLRQACSVLCDLTYIEAMCHHRLVYDVIDSLVQAYAMLRASRMRRQMRGGMARSTMPTVDSETPGGLFHAPLPQPSARLDTERSRTTEPGAHPPRLRLVPRREEASSVLTHRTDMSPTAFASPRTTGGTVSHQERVPMGLALIQSEQHGSPRALVAARGRQSKLGRESVAASSAFSMSPRGVPPSVLKAPPSFGGGSASVAHAQREGLVAALLRWLQADIHILLQHPDLTLQRAVNLPDDSLVVPVALEELSKRATRRSAAAAVAVAAATASPGLSSASTGSEQAVSGSSSAVGATSEVLGSRLSPRASGPPAIPITVPEDDVNQTQSHSSEHTYIQWVNKPQKRNACIMSLTCFGGRVSAVQYTPQGDRLGSAHKDGVVRLWHTTTGDVERTLVMPDAQPREVTCFKFRPTDNSMLVSGTSDGHVVLWDYEAGLCKLIRRPQDGTAQATAVQPASSPMRTQVVQAREAATKRRNLAATTAAHRPVGIVAKHRRRRIRRRYRDATHRALAHKDDAAFMEALHNSDTEPGTSSESDSGSDEVTSSPRVSASPTPTPTHAAHVGGEDMAFAPSAHDCGVSLVEWHANGDVIVSGDEQGNIILWDVSKPEYRAFGPESQMPPVIHMWHAHRTSIVSAAFVPSSWQPQNRLVKAGITARQTARHTAMGFIQARDTSDPSAGVATAAATAAVTGAAVHPEATSLETVAARKDTSDARQDPLHAAVRRAARRVSIIEGSNGPIVEGSDGRPTWMLVTSDHRVTNIWLTYRDTSSHTLQLQHAGCVTGSGLAMGVTSDTLLCLTQNSNKALRILDTSAATRVELREESGKLAACGSFGKRRQVAVGCSDGSIRLYSRTTGKRTGIMVGPLGAITCCCHSPDGGATIASGSQDGTVRVWMPRLLVMRKQPVSHKAPVIQACFANYRDSSVIATGSSDGVVLLWNKGRHRAWKRVTARSAHLDTLKFMVGAVNVLVASSVSGLRVWHFDPETKGRVLPRDLTKEPIATWVSAPAGPSLAFSASGHESSKEGIQIVDAVTGTTVGKFPALGVGGATAVALDYSPDGRVLASSSNKGQVLLWDLASLPKPGATVSNRVIQPLCELVDVSAAAVQEKQVKHLRFSPDGKWLICLTKRGSSMKLWNLVLAIRRLADKSFTAGSERGTDSSNGDDLVRSVSGHTSVVNSAEWSPDARFLISGGRDGTLRLWELQTIHTLRLLGGAKPHGGAPIITTAFSFTGKRMLSLGGDSVVRVWDFEGQCVAKWVHPDVQPTCVGMDVRGETLVVGAKRGSVQHLQLQGDTDNDQRPVATLTRLYFPEKHMWHPRATIRCPFCGSVFAPNSASVSVVKTLQRSLDTFGPFPQFFTDSRLRCRCTKCKRIMQLNPFMVENPYRLLQGVERIVGPGARAAAVSRQRHRRERASGASKGVGAASKRPARPPRNPSRRGAGSGAPGSKVWGARQTRVQRGERRHPTTTKDLYARTVRKRAALRAAGAIPHALRNRQAVTGVGVELPKLGAESGAAPAVKMMRNAAAKPLMKQTRRLTYSFDKLPAVPM